MQEERRSIAELEVLEMSRRQLCVIAVCTYKRPLLLRSLLQKLNAQPFPNAEVDVHVLIVDNDIEQSARVVFDDCSSGFKNVTMHYLPAQPQGLVIARNAALDYAKFLDAPVIFIDDDESPRSDWFQALWDMHMAFPRDVIAGPVVPQFEVEPPFWCESGAYWNRPTFEDASVLQKPTGDGNILFPPALVQNWRYSLRYNTSGAQDTHLLTRWIAAGQGLRWSARAVVTEIVPAGRMTFRYALDRAYFSSLAYVWVDREFGSSAAWTLLRAGRRLTIGFADYAVSLLRRDIWIRHRALLHFSSARGTFDGLRLTSFDRYTDYQIDASTKS
ncbi:glycosyltransferase family A protein [Arthrobacter sp. Soil762]|uniref:glycosyltransferase family A protein n=1 Tax=Arthrobacter sp. Soil762 TaxID=1736401 RepID=UPI0009E951DB|nr:glycosyltransferase family A protein [Arthrobacter sp. Soil762]